MKTRIIALAAAAALCVGSIGVIAAGGSASDPLISLSYLTSTFQTALDSKINSKLDNSDKQITAAVSGETGTAATQLRLKSGDTVKCTTGMTFVTLAGKITATFSAGALVDATTGSEIKTGTTLSPYHKYIVAEGTSVTYTVIGSTAVVEYGGAPEIAYSTQPDYNAMAAALKKLTLFHGSGVSYGSGYSLETAPTRTEALVMLIRLLGEEETALACSYKHNFTDVPQWADRYVAYAYEKGYTNGISRTKFGSTNTASAAMYTEFVMRALGYSDISHKDISTTLSDALKSGIINNAEYTKLTGASFLRSEVVYLSYYALSVKLSGSTKTLEQTLTDKSVFTAADATAAHALVTTSRLS